MKVLAKPADLQAFALLQRAQGQTIGLVPTMGALHDGHLSLIRQARADCDVVIVSLFVNPTQFGPNEDLARYPRKFEADCQAAEAAGADALFAPMPADMYGTGYQTYVEVGPVAKRLCGASRPGHFRGVCTVVLKLFNLAQPTRAYFGRKDYQQFRVLERMVRDFNLPLEIVPMPIVREEDGLARSSRNAYLSAAERQAALVLKRSLDATFEQWQQGQREVTALRKAVEDIISAEPLARVDYVELVNPETLEPESGTPETLLVALAVYIGKTRLIDNQELLPGRKRI